MSLRLIPAALFTTLTACTPAAGDVAATHVTAVQATPATQARPVETEAPEPSLPSRLHGNWRLLAVDDPHDAALMAFSVQADDGDTAGSGDFVLFQPFCDAVAGAPITGTADCELIGLGATFDRVEIEGDRIVLVFHPTADGLPHRLELRRDGAALVGDYVADGNGIRRTVRAESAIEG